MRFLRPNKAFGGQKIDFLKKPEFCDLSEHGGWSREWPQAPWQCRASWCNSLNPLPAPAPLWSAYIGGTGHGARQFPYVAWPISIYLVFLDAVASLALGHDCHSLTYQFVKSNKMSKYQVSQSSESFSQVSLSVKWVVQSSESFKWVVQSSKSFSQVSHSVK